MKKRKEKELALTVIIEFISPVIIDAWMNVQVEILPVTMDCTPRFPGVVTIVIDKRMDLGGLLTGSTSLRLLLVDWFIA